MKLMLKTRSQRGITSIVVVFILVVLLSLVGISFTKVMNRSLQSSSASEQASAASYAAQSGINDAISYIAKSLQANPNADVSSTQCGKLIGSGGPLEAAAKQSPDGNTPYTCVLVDPNPTSLFYQNLAPYKSQVIKITTNTPLTSLLFSWQASDRTRNQFVPPSKGTVLYDEKTWSDSNYAPLLRVTLYPIPASGDLTNVQANSKTFFLYPQTGSGSNSLAYGSSSGLAPVNCSSKNLGTFSGTADYDCNLVITNLASAGAAYFYARLTPFYAQSVIKVKGNDGSNQTVQFKNVQSVIDVTAKSGSAVKRLQARMDSSSSGSGTDLNISSGSDNLPEFALQTASTLCKRLLIPPATTNPATIDPGSVLNCGFSLSGPSPVPACKDTKDNDGDGKIDMADPGCSNPDDNDETDPPAGGGGGGGDNNAPQGGSGDVVCWANFANGWGNCTNSQFGGVPITVNGCKAMADQNGHNLGFVVDPNCPGAGSVTAADVINALAKQKDSLASYCTSTPGSTNFNTNPSVTGVTCFSSTDPNQNFSCANGYEGNPVAPDYLIDAGGCTRIQVVQPPPSKPSPTGGEDTCDAVCRAAKNPPPAPTPPTVRTPTCGNVGMLGTWPNCYDPTPTPTPTPKPKPKPSGGGCFVAGTMVLTPDGQKAIEKIKIGDYVLVWDFNLGRKVPSRVTETFKYEDKATLELISSKGQKVTTTSVHRFWTGNEWLAAGNFMPGWTHIIDSQGNPQEVASVKNGPKADVYNLHVAHPDHNYYAGGFLVHNVKN